MNHPITTTQIPTFKSNHPLGQVLAFKNTPDQLLARMEQLESPVVKFRLAHLPCYYLTTPEAVHQVLVKDSQNYLKDGPFFKATKMVLGHGLAFSDGDIWKRDRRMMAPIFHKKCIDGFFGLMLDFANRLVNDLKTNREVVDIHAIFNELAMNIATNALFGADLDKNKSDILLAKFKIMVDDIIKRMSGLSFPLWVPTPANQKLKNAVKVYSEGMKEIIEDKVKNPGHTMLDLLMHAKDPETGELMHLQELIDQVRVFFAAGTETTANALTWTLYLLARHPKAMTKLRQEIEQVLQGEEPTLEKLPQLAYLHQVIQESMRLHSPVWVLTRQNKATATIAGYTLPPRSNIFFSAYMLHRNPRYWDKPNDFIPERFAPGKLSKEDLKAFIPFGAGPRKCIGDRFADMEIKIVLIRILQSLDWKLRDSSEAPQWFSGSLQPKNGMWMSFQPVESKVAVR
ncbi:MAG TPA: hypothetical protein DCS93_14555 [Microscillaceae bacterium]|nr:hypothetical protein [Microscillaceae bacterium]